MEQKATKANLQEAFKCGECLHFKQTPHRKNKDVCSKEGIRSFALAPKCYTPDYTKVIGSTDEFVSLCNFFGSKTSQQKKILLGMLRQQPHGKKLKMGTKLYLNLRNRDYINNYVCGYVVGYSSGGEIVLAGSPQLKTQGKTFFAYLKSDSGALTPKEWKEKYSILKKKGRLVDPDARGKRDITESIKEDNYEIPTIDMAPKEKKSPKLNKRTSSLIQIMSI